MAHLGVYIDGICGGVDGVPVGMDNFSITASSFEYLYLAQKGTYLRGSGLTNYGFPILQKIYLRCDPGYKVTSGSITVAQRAGYSGNQLTGLGTSSMRSFYLMPFAMPIGGKLFYNGETLDDDIAASLEGFSAKYSMSVDLSKYNITDTNACLALLIIPYNNEGATLQSLLTLSFSEEVV